jgi:hypothetical protein
VGQLYIDDIEIIVKHQQNLNNNLLEFRVSLILWWVYVAVAKEVGGLVAAIDGAETASGHRGPEPAPTKTPTTGPPSSSAA